MQRSVLRLASACLVVGALAAAAHADEGLDADEIARRTLRADSFGWEGARTRLKMVLVEPDGKRKERAMEVTALRSGGRLSSKMRFASPPDLAGTAFLMLEQAGGASEQYIYLSGLKRTRRIVGREREGSFMGSDFTYTDMQPIAPGQSKNSRLPDEAIGKDACYVIETVILPSAGSAYAKLITWVRKSDFVALRTRFVDRAGKVVKTLYARRVRDIDGKPVVVEARMESANGHATELIIESIERRKDLTEATFSPNALDRP